MRRGQEHPTQSDWTYCTISKPLNAHAQLRYSLRFAQLTRGLNISTQHFVGLSLAIMLVAHLIGPIGLLMNMHNLNYVSNLSYFVNCHK